MNGQGIGFHLWSEEEIFPYSTMSSLVLGASQPCLEWILLNLSLGVKREKREAGHIPPFIA